MSFVKLDCGILDSTLWLDRPAREVFVTALLMARHHEVREPMEQINVRDLNPTGFTVPPGWYGFVPAAGTGICRRAGIDLEEGLNALERLGAADAESRSPDHEGRRLVRVAGGYLILNFDRYREKDHTAAERSKRYREKRFASRCDATGEPRNVTQAEAEAEGIKNSPQPPKGGDGAGRTAEPEPPTPPKAGKAENLPPIPVVLDTPNFRKVWDEWQAYRKPLGGVKDWPKLWTRQLDQLAEYGEPGAIASLKASMVGGWRGLFPPRGLPGLAGKPRTSGPDLSDWARRQRGAGASPAGGAA